MARWKITLLLIVLCTMVSMCVSAKERAKNKLSDEKEDKKEDKVARGAVGVFICAIIISFQAAKNH